MTADRPEGHDTVISKGPCPKCGSKDNNVTYADGHEHCYSAGCDHYKPPSEGGTSKPSSTARPFGGASSELLDPLQQPGAWDGLDRRGLTSETCRKYGVFRAGFSNQKAVVYPYFDMGGDIAAQKIRLPDKSFPTLKVPGAPSVGECQLFGRHVFGDRFDRQVVVTEGEYDAMAVAQATSFKLAAVSINAGAGNAAKNLKANYLWLDRFAEIILWFDDDEPGREAAEECAKLFKVGKVRIAKANGFKDANEVLVANKPGDIQTAIYMAQAWRPKGIVNGKDTQSAITAPDTQTISYSYPEAMAKMQEMTGGIFAGEVVYHVAGTGVGKSTALREIEYDLTKQGAKIAVMSFEDTLRDAAFGIMSIHASERLHLVPVPSPNDVDGRAVYDARMLKVHAEVFGGGKIELFDPETAEWSVDAILGYVRYCAKALDCEVVVIDPISFVASGIDLKADERRVLDMVAGEFSKLAKELGIHILVAHHLKRNSGIPHEEGAPTSLNELRSSGGLANFATCVVGWERNNQAEGDGFRVTQSRILKPARRTGRSGLADVLYYTEAGRLIPSPIPFPPVGKPEGADGEGRRGGGFAPASDTDY